MYKTEQINNFSCEERQILKELIKREVSRINSIYQKHKLRQIKSKL